MPSFYRTAWAGFSRSSTASFDRPTRHSICPPSAAKGFGQPPPPRAKKPKSKTKQRKQTSPISSDQAVQRAVDIAEGGRKARPVTDAEAAQGRLDYVQVKDWGSGNRKDLGGLQVESVSRVTSDTKQPFYEQLARYLEMCQVRGDLRSASGPALPPFERWAFRRQHYVQYLVDQHRWHRALEEATLSALQPCHDPVAQADVADAEAAYPETGTDEACAALEAFHPNDAGNLTRGDALCADLDAIAQQSPSQDSNPYQFHASSHAESCAEYLHTLANVAQDDSAGESAQNEARMHLLAHLYSGHVTHLTTGMRVGAAATEKLGLFQIGATKYYDGYPNDMQDPLQYFIAVMNQMGRSLSTENKQLLLAELPSAFTKTSQMMTALAKSS